MSFILNAAPISYEGIRIPIELFPFSDEKLQELRDENAKSHLIKHRGDHILAVPLKTDEPSLGGQVTQIDLQQDLSLAKALASNAIYRKLYRRQLEYGYFRQNPNSAWIP
ncbi:hypothetical protein ACUN24_09205 [Pedobacter sp. WC2501]|uniref:hypothetical protein n=1 Tax=Pedobacter sp. WC2501 TaxID=3461400 RepID=UPI004046132C